MSTVWGATLYHLLTGQAPISNQSPKLTLPELLQRVQRGDFPPPSGINSQIPKPLEAICVKAMSLRPSDRYASTAELAADVERYLADEPVSAHAEPFTIRARRWIKRHQVCVTSLAAAVVVALVGLRVLSAVVRGSNQRLNSANITIRDQNSAITGKIEELPNTNVHIGAARTDANQQRDNAVEQKTRADAKADEARLNLYSAHMNLAQRNWESSAVVLVLDSLEMTQPQSDETDFRGFEWYYWSRLCHSSLLGLKGHTRGGGNSMVFSPDGKRLASASTDQTVKVWDATSGAESLTLKGHTSGVVGVA